MCVDHDMLANYQALSDFATGMDNPKAERADEARRQAESERQIAIDEFMRVTEPVRVHLLQLVAPVEELLDRFMVWVILSDLSKSRDFQGEVSPVRPDFYDRVVINPKKEYKDSNLSRIASLLQLVRLDGYGFSLTSVWGSEITFNTFRDEYNYSSPTSFTIGLETLWGGGGGSRREVYRQRAVRVRISDRIRIVSANPSDEQDQLSLAKASIFPLERATPDYCLMYKFTRTMTLVGRLPSMSLEGSLYRDKGEIIIDPVVNSHVVLGSGIVESTAQPNALRTLIMDNLSDLRKARKI